MNLFEPDFKVFPKQQSSENILNEKTSKIKKIEIGDNLSIVLISFLIFILMWFGKC